MKKAKETATSKYVRDYVHNMDKEGKTILLIGDAPKELDAVKPNMVRIKGTIGAPAEFYKKRNHLHNPDNCHVLYDIQKGTIKLVVDENYNSLNTEVEGAIVPNPDLTEMHINTGKRYTIKELMNTLKFNRVHFVEKDQNAKIVTQLQQYKARVEKTLEDGDDQRGNSQKVKIQKLESELEESFTLEMPIHKNGVKYRFMVEVLCEVTDASVSVWLESRDLKELQVTATEQLINSELVKFKDIVCIAQ